MMGTNLKSMSLLRRRIYAFAIDLLCIPFAHKVIHFSYRQFVKETMVFINPEIIDQLLVQNNLLKFYSFSLTLVAYFTLSYYMSSGKTFGKNLFGIQINQSTTLLQALSRSLGYLFCYMTGGIAILLPAITGHKGIPDWMSSTEVSLQPLTLSEQPFPEDQSSDFYYKAG
jgi:hypothetical protein